MNSTRFLVPIVVAASLIVPAAASAETVSRNVPYRDLNLASPAGVRQLDRRIAGTVALLCGRALSFAVSEIREVRRCRADAFASARSQRDTRIAAAQVRSIELASR